MQCPKECPKCKTPWLEEQTIYEFFYTKYGDETQAKRYASYYGCTPETPQHFSKNVVGIEDYTYDGVSYWRCLKCEKEFNRWNMNERVEWKRNIFP